MNIHRIYTAFFLAMLCGLLGTSALAQSPKTPQMRIEAAPTKLYEGESFRFLIHLDNIDETAPPDTAYLEPEFHVEYLGPQRRNSSRVTVINNVMKKEEDRGVTFSYVLTPKNAGKIEINPPEIVVDGKVLSANSITIDVIEPSDQDRVKLEVSTDQANVYPLTPFDVTLSVFVRELPGKYASADPVRDLVGEIGAPALSILWADDAALPPGVVPEKSWQDWITSYQNESGGFSINGIRAGGPFDFGWAFGDRNQNLALFLPKPERVELPDQDGNPVRWLRYDFKRSFTAEKIGPVSFDSVSLKGLFAVPGEGDKLSAERFYTLSKPLDLTIRDVPADNRPNDYIGAFGQFDFDVALVPETARVGEAMTLTVALKGKGSVLNVKAPDLESNSAITDHFKLYPPTEQTSDGGAQWTWSLRPLTDGVLEFPPLSVSYFDVQKEKFVTLQSKPIPVTVEKSAGNTVASTAVLPKNDFDRTRSLEGIFGNQPIPTGRMNRRLSFGVWGVATGTLWGATLLLWGGTLFVRRRSSSGAVRLNRAIAQSRETLADGLNRLSENRPAPESRAESTAAIRLILNAFLIPVADRFGSKIDAVSGAEFVRFLGLFDAARDTTSGAAKEVASDSLYREIAEKIERLDQIQYGSEPFDAESAADWQTLHRRWTDRLATLGTKHIPHAKARKNSSARFGLLALALGILAFGCSGPKDEIAREQFAKALARFDQADTLAAAEKENGANDSDTATAPTESETTARDLFLKSAATYEGIQKMGVVSGPILFNQGNAYFRAGEKAQALAAWRRAEPFLPSDPYLKANIESVTSNDSQKRPLFETIFFWQNRLSAAAKGTLSILFAALACAAFLVLIWGNGLSREKRKILRRTFGVLFALFLLASVSYLYDANRFKPGRHGIAAVETDVRKGPSERYEPLFRDPVAPGTEFAVRDNRNGWLEAALSDGQTGWIAEADSVVW